MTLQEEEILQEKKNYTAKCEEHEANLREFKIKDGILNEEKQKLEAEKSKVQKLAKDLDVWKNTMLQQQK